MTRTHRRNDPPYGTEAADAGVPGASACLDEHLLAALADGSLDRASHRDILPHLRSCATCLAAVAGATDAVAAPAVARERMRIDRGRWTWARRLAVPAAAAAVLILVRLGGGPEDRPHRGPTVVAGSVPVAISPVDELPAGAPLVWRPAAGADVYRVVLFSEAGDVLFEQRTADTTLVLPASVALVPGRVYLWSIGARIGWERWSGSELMSFRAGADDGG